MTYVQSADEEYMQQQSMQGMNMMGMQNMGDMMGMNPQKQKKVELEYSLRPPMIRSQLNAAAYVY